MVVYYPAGYLILFSHLWDMRMGTEEHPVLITILMNYLLTPYFHVISSYHFWPIHLHIQHTISPLCNFFTILLSSLEILEIFFCTFFKTLTLLFSPLFKLFIKIGREEGREASTGSLSKTYYFPIPHLPESHKYTLTTHTYTHRDRQTDTDTHTLRVVGCEPVHSSSDSGCHRHFHTATHITQRGNNS